MPQYLTTWLDYQLPGGSDFAVAVCGYSGKIRHMVIGKDPLRRMMVRSVDVNGDSCTSSQHCIALKCPLNNTGPQHLAHMLDMAVDEELDSDTAKEWGTSSTVEGLVKFADNLNCSLPEAFKVNHNNESCA